MKKSLKNKSREYGRVRSEKVIEEEFKLLLKLQKRRKISFLFPKPVSFDREKNEMEVEDIDGRNLGGLIKERDPYLNSILFLSGKNLKLFHNTLKRRLASRGDVEIIREEIYSYLNNWDNFGLSKVFVKELKIKVEELFKKLDLKEIAYTGLHNDFSPPNIIWDGKKIYFVDLAGFDYGLNYKDVAELILTIKTYEKRPFFNGAKLIKRFLGGYGGVNLINLKFFKLHKTLYFMDDYMKNIQFYPKLSLKYLNHLLVMRIFKKELRKEVKW